MKRVLQARSAVPMNFQGNDRRPRTKARLSKKARARILECSGLQWHSSFVKGSHKTWTIQKVFYDTTGAGPTEDFSRLSIGHADKSQPECLGGFYVPNPISDQNYSFEVLPPVVENCSPYRGFDNRFPGRPILGKRHR